MTQTDKPSVEGVNRKIAEFMGYTFDDNGVVRSGPDDLLKLVKHSVFLDVRHCKFHSSWDWLIPAWKKVYDYYILNLDKWPTVQDFVLKLYEPMKNAMITGNITTAHKILYDAILWIKNNEG